MTIEIKYQVNNPQIEEMAVAIKYLVNNPQIEEMAVATSKSLTLESDS